MRKLGWRAVPVWNHVHVQMEHGLFACGTIVLLVVFGSKDMSTAGKDELRTIVSAT